jgi:hypothetical protein
MDATYGHGPRALVQQAILRVPLTARVDALPRRGPPLPAAPRPPPPYPVLQSLRAAWDAMAEDSTRCWKVLVVEGEPLVEAAPATMPAQAPPAEAAAPSGVVRTRWRSLEAALNHEPIGAAAEDAAPHAVRHDPLDALAVAAAGSAAASPRPVAVRGPGSTSDTGLMVVGSALGGSGAMTRGGRLHQAVPPMSKRHAVVPPVASSGVRKPASPRAPAAPTQLPPSSPPASPSRRAGLPSRPAPTVAVPSDHKGAPDRAPMPLSTVTVSLSAVPTPGAQHGGATLPLAQPPPLPHPGAAPAPAPLPSPAPAAPPSLRRVFPSATAAELDLRQRLREAVFARLQHAGLMEEWAPQGSGVGTPANAGSDPRPQREEALRRALEPVAVEALLLAFDKFAPRDSADLIRASSERDRTADRRGHLYSTVSLAEFQRAIASFGVRLPDGDVAAAVGRLGLLTAPEQRVRHRDFVRFLSLALDGADMAHAAAKAVSGRGPGGVDAEHAEAGAPPTSPRRRGSPDGGAGERHMSHSPSRGTPAKVEVVYGDGNPWDVLLAHGEAAVRARRPRFATTWPPSNIGDAHNAFWAAVNALEAAVMAEVRKRATVGSTAKEPTARFSPAHRYGASVVSAGESGNFILRRAFAFFDRGHAKAVTLDEFHATLAELRLVDPPARLFSGLPMLHAGGGTAAAIEDGVGTEHARPAAEGAPDADATPAPPVVDVLSRLAPDTLSPGARAAVRHPAAGSPRKDAGSPEVAPGSVPVESTLSLAARRLCAAVFRRMHGEGDVGLAAAATAAGGAGRASHAPPVAASAARASAAAVLASLSDEDPVVCKPLTYNSFARWAAPLNSKLRRVRDKLELMFRAAATLGGGAKDFARAFRLLAKRHGTTSSLSAADIRSLLGHQARTLSDAELQVCATVGAG